MFRLAQVIQAIPNAIGALCLNQVGQDQLSGHPTIIPGIFSIFTSDRHLKVLLDKENAVLIGTAMDELIRHHPSLKTIVFESIKSTLSKIEILGEAYVVPADIQHWYKLVPAPESPADEGAPMEGVESENNSSLDSKPSEVARHDESTFIVEESVPKPHDNNIVSYIDAIGRVRN
jgi:E3 ubiquitin-protein ligase HUWE1